MNRNVIAALGLTGLGGCLGGGNTALTTVPTANLAITLPATTVVAGTPFTFTVTAVDATNAVVPTYIGTVHITTSDASATLPGDATLARGVGSFTVTFNTTGSQTITASDTVGDASPGTSPDVAVKPIPAPTVTSISPTSAFAGDVGFTLSVAGSNLVPSSVVQWNGGNRPTVFVSSSEVTAQISAADIATAGTATVTVFTPVSGGGTSNTSTFTINPCGPVVPQSLAIDPTGKFVYVAGTVCPKALDGYVSMFAINPATGALTSIGPPVPTRDAGARFVTVDPSGKFAYVANWGEGDLPGSVSTFAIDSSTGALTFTGTAGAPCTFGPGSCAPWAIAVHPSGKFAYVAYEGGFAPTGVSTYAINATTGALSLLDTILSGDRANSVTVDPTGKFVYSTNSDGNSGSNDVAMFSIDSGGPLTSIGFVAAGTAPVSVVVDPAGKFAYVTSNDLLIYAIDGTTGVLTPVGTVGAAGLAAIHPSGKFAYVTTSGSNVVSIYNIDAATGALTATGTVAAGASIAAIHPSGKFAYGYVTNSVGSLDIAFYSIDAATGALTLIGTIGL